MKISIFLTVYDELTRAENVLIMLSLLVIFIELVKSTGPMLWTIVLTCAILMAISALPLCSTQLTRSVLRWLEATSTGRTGIISQYFGHRKRAVPAVLKFGMVSRELSTLDRFHSDVSPPISIHVCTRTAAVRIYAYSNCNRTFAVVPILWTAEHAKLVRFE